MPPYARRRDRLASWNDEMGQPYPIPWLADVGLCHTIHTGTLGSLFVPPEDAVHAYEQAEFGLE